MATQGATLGRGTLHLPIWPLAAIVAGAAALMIGLTLNDASRPSTVVVERPDALPAVGISHVTPNATTSGFVGLENPGAVIAQAPTYAVGLENPGAYVAQAPTYAVGLENPGAYVVQTPTFQVGLENPGAYPAVSDGGSFTPTLGSRPGMTGGEICGQCR